MKMLGNYTRTRAAKTRADAVREGGGIEITVGLAPLRVKAAVPAGDWTDYTGELGSRLNATGVLGLTVCTGEVRTKAEFSGRTTSFP